MDCCVCLNRIEGDEAFLSHHLNKCLDAPESSRILINDVLLSDQLQTQFEAEDSERFPEFALQLQLEQNSNNRSYRLSALHDDKEVECCPNCQQSWQLLEIGNGDQDRSSHVSACLDAAESALVFASMEQDDVEGSIPLVLGTGKGKDNVVGTQRKNVYVSNALCL